MPVALRLSATVQANNRIVITDPALREGAVVAVTVEFPDPSEHRQSALAVIRDLGRRRHFQSPEEVDRYLENERASWDR
jgi:hypothetical protein